MMIILFTQYLYFFLFTCFLIGLAIGSFLNVVIYRLPIMLQNAWRGECCELLQLENKKNNPINLALPHSFCPHCQNKLRSWHNIPVISYLFLKGKCAFCKTPITWRYPLIELMTGLVTLFIASYYGISGQSCAIMLFTWCLIALTFIDFEHQLLPDIITLPLLWVGLLLNISGTFTTLPAAVIGAVAGYLSLWSVAKLYELATGKAGMGYGDFKLLALIGAWLGWQILPLIVLLASLLGSIVGISLIIFKKHDRHIPISFGPYLAIAGWLGLLFNNELPKIYGWLI